MKKDNNCIFCKIIDGKIPCAKVYETDRVLAFLDISPVNKGHTLVVPKSHSPNMLEDSSDDLKECMEAVKIVGNAVMKATGAQGFNLIVNTKPAAGQVVFHTHLHVIPRFEGDGLRHWPGKKYQEGETENVRKDIVANISV